MPSFFSKKKSTDPQTPPVEPTTSKSPARSPEKEKRGYFAKERDKDRLKRSSKSFSRTTSRRGSDEHPLNLPPDELRRLSALSAQKMSSSPRDSREGGVPVPSDPMETTPAPETPGAFPTTDATETTNGTNGETHPGDDEQEQRPTPPPHKSQPSSPPRQEPRPEEAEAFKAEGNKYYKAGKYAAAIEEYGKAIEANPTSTYLSNRAAAYMAAGKYTEALEDCKRADELEPGNPKILHRQAKILTALGEPQAALDVYDRIDPPATAKDRQQAQAMQKYISEAHDNLNNSASGSMVLFALDQAERSLGTTVQPPRKWRLMRGEAYLKMGTVNSLGDAQNVAMALLRGNNADPEALVLRGRALYGQGENDKAIQHFRQALSCDPDFKDAVKWLRLVQKLDKTKAEGNEHFKYGRYPQAVETYTSALDIDPSNKGTNSKLLNNRAMCYTKLKKWQDAINDCDAALKLDPSYIKASKTRAKALGASGDWEEAVRAFKNIAEQHPEEPGIAKEVRDAELELKKSKRKDYYKILGIEKDCSDTDIKKAYRKLAVVHHPDKNPDDPEAENRFKEIQEAHETLIDPQKRQRYDSGVDLMEDGGMGGGFPGGMGGMGGFGGGGVQIDPEVLFNMMGGGMGGGGGGGGFRFASGGGAPRGFPGGGQGFSPFG